MALLLLLVALVLFVPASFSASGSVNLEPPEDGIGADDACWLEAISPGAGRDDPGEDGRAALPSVQGTFSGRLRWMGGAVVVDRSGVTVFGWRPRLRTRPRGAKERLSGLPGGRRRSREKRALNGAGRSRGTGAGRRRRLDLATARRLLPAAWAAFLRSWSALALRLHVRLSFGTGDPATTAFLAAPVAAAVYPLARAASARRPGSVGLVLSPVFDREMIAASFDLSGRTGVFAVLWPLAKFALRRDVRRLWWPGRKRGSNTPKGSTKRKEEAA